MSKQSWRWLRSAWNDTWNKGIFQTLTVSVRIFSSEEPVTSHDSGVVPQNPRTDSEVRSNTDIVSWSTVSRGQSCKCPNFNLSVSELKTRVASKRQLVTLVEQPVQWATRSQRNRYFTWIMNRVSEQPFPLLYCIISSVGYCIIELGSPSPFPC